MTFGAFDAIGTVRQGAARLDARPVRPVSSHTVWEEAIEARNRLAGAMESALAREGVRATILKSEAGNYPVWLRLEAWLPVGGADRSATRRSRFELIVDGRPFHRSRLVYTVRGERGGKALPVVECTRFEEDDAVAWARYMVGLGPAPSRHLHQRHNPVAREFRNDLFDARAIAMIAAGALIGALCVAEAAGTWPEPGRAAYAVLFLCIGAPALYLAFGRFAYRDCVVAQPRQAPRNLAYLDGWHTVVASLGGDHEILKALVRTTLEKSHAADCSIGTEVHCHATANGFEARERLVLSRGQGVVYVHIHAVGNDLFVGWEAHLNWAQWVETAPVAIRHTRTSSTAFHDLVPGWYSPGALDLVDAEGLSAMVHRTLERELKSLLEERGIEQEIDFDVVRRERTNALDRRALWPERSGERKRDFAKAFGGFVRRASAGEMKLTDLQAGAPARRRGLAAIPAVFLLPAVAVGAGLLVTPLVLALGDDWFQLLLPLLHMPPAAALALGLWLYADVRAFHALLFAAFAYVLAAAVGSTPFVFPVYPLSLLLVAVLWAPQLRGAGFMAVATLLFLFLPQLAFPAIVGYKLEGRGVSLRSALGAMGAFSKADGDRPASAQQPAIALPAAGPVWLLLALGIGGLFLSFNLDRGTATEMGSGALPVALSALLILFAGGATIEQMLSRRSKPAPSYAALSVVALAGVAFAYAVAALGIAVAAALATGIPAGYAVRRRPRAMVAAVFVAVVVAVIATVAFKLPFRLMPA